MERKILGGAVFDLLAVQSYVRMAGVDALNLATTKAGSDLLIKLRWRLTDVCGFIGCLKKIHYRYSEWVCGSDKAKIVYPADVYIMGYNRIKVQEWPQLDPWNYFKL